MTVVPTRCINHDYPDSFYCPWCARDRAEAEASKLRAALKDLLEDTQHADHHCSDNPEECPVAHARHALGLLPENGSGS